MNSIALPSPHELKQTFPLSKEGVQFIAYCRAAAKNILKGTDRRKAIIVGPCSIHDLNSAVEYAKLFKSLSERVSKTCVMFMRVYAEKARTASGWKGLMNDPYLDGTNDIKTGLFLTRKLLLTLTEMQIPIATEFVDPLAALYIDDLISWGFIGARTCESPMNRQLASYLTMPIGFKNSTDGNLDNAINGALFAREPHVFMNIDPSGKLCALQSRGNLATHIVLRGSNDATNYDPISVTTALNKLQRSRLPQRLLIDCAHGNCQKQYLKQKEVFYSIIDQIGNGNENIIGLMLESHLEEGNQILTKNHAALKSAVSITDPCLNWETTAELISHCHPQ